MNIKIKLNGQPLPVCNGAMYDLSTSEDITLLKGEYRAIPLGICMELPAGYYARVYPRSSTYKNWHLIMTNSVGIIDNAYCGDNDVWHFPALAHETVKVPKGTRIAQFEVCEIQDAINFIEVDNLWNDNRGGFGSTGV